MCIMALEKKTGAPTPQAPHTNGDRRVETNSDEEGRRCGRCGGSGSIGGRHLAGLAELATDQFGDAGKVDCPTCGGTGRAD